MYYLQIIIGASLLLLIGAVFSNNAKKINPKYLFNAILLQFVLAILLIKVPFITAFFESISQGVLALKAATDQGTGFVFGYLAGIVGAYKGFTTEGGTEGVGKASTTSVVLASLLILIFDMVLVKLTLWLWPTV